MFKNEVAEFIYKRTYSRWLETENRREDWPETIERFLSFLISEKPDIPEKTINKIRKYMMEFAVMPSMRFLWAAGPAAKADNTTIYNCSFAKMCFSSLDTLYAFLMSANAISSLQSLHLLM